MTTTTTRSRSRVTSLLTPSQWSRRVRRKMLARSDPRHQANMIDDDVMLGEAVLGGDVGIDAHVRLVGDVTIGGYTTVGRFSILQGPVRVGRYTQIGPNVGIYANNHGIDHVTMYNNRRLFGGRLKALESSSPIDIGNDVWIGFGAVILPGVTVGDGAVIGAGAVVTKDVPAYAIAVGNPANVIRQRVSDDVAKALGDWAWWQHDPDELTPFEPLFTLDLNADPSAVERLNARR